MNTAYKYKVTARGMGVGNQDFVGYYDEARLLLAFARGTANNQRDYAQITGLAVGDTYDDEHGDTWERVP